MKKILAPNTNCWQSFLACMTDSSLLNTADCSTKNQGWKECTRAFLAGQGLFYVETHPEAITALPEGSLVGAGVEGSNGKDHIVIAKVNRQRFNHGFEVWHDPSGSLQPGTQLEAGKVILICRLDTP